MTQNKPSSLLLISLPGPYTPVSKQFPLGIGYLVAMLKQDRPVHAVHYQQFEQAQAQIPDIIHTHQPDVVGLSCTTFNRAAVQRVCKWLRAAYPQIKLVLGGVHASFLFEQALRNYGADCVVIGEGELTLRELCNAFDVNRPLNEVRGIAFLDNDTLVITPRREAVQNLDDLPMPDYSFAADMIRSMGMGFLIGSRGCPVLCSFCSTSSYWGQHVRTNSPTRVVDEMEMLAKTYGVSKVFFYDDTFNLGLKRVRAICEEIQVRGLKLEWGASCRVRPASEEMIDLMVASGCRHICWGIESGSEEILESIGKKITLDQIRHAFNLCRKHLGRLSVGAFTMVGNQGETEETITKSVAFLNTLPMTDSPSASILYILPGTDLYRRLSSIVPNIDNHWIEEENVPLYTLEHPIEKLISWREKISRSGCIIPFDRSQHFWNGVLFNHTVPPMPALTSELSQIIPPEIKDDEFYELIQQLSQKADINTVLEIGSSAGGGSTEAFVKGLKKNPGAVKLFCMEVSVPRFKQLQHRHQDIPFVHCYNVSSVPISCFPSEHELELFYSSVPTALNNYPWEQVLGWLRQDIDYIRQTNAPEKGIQLIKQKNNVDIFDMVLIDGSEFLGRAELEEVYGSKIILLDDINGFKNYHNRQRLLADPNYSLIHENAQLRNGYSVFQKKSDANLPISFFTIVLNGEPFIRHHIDIFQQLTCRWSWHIVEGVADLVHDTAWSVSNGGQITDELHANGLSNDGTSQYLDKLAARYPEQVTIYRKPSGQFWNGKLEMVNAPLAKIHEECLLWQVDSDELWNSESIERLCNLFIQHPERTAAYCYCDYFVGPHKYISSLNTWATRPNEWLRVWRFKPDMSWAAHEPPTLVNHTGSNVADLRPFRREESVAAGATFQHFAYVVKSQVRFKEIYYGYRNAVSCWQQLQQTSGPVKSSDYLSWSVPDAIVDNWPADAAPHLAERLLATAPPHKKIKLLLVYSMHPVFPAITLPEWIKETLRTYYADDVEVLACGPDNEIPIADSPHFYTDVASLVRTQSVDILWDIEGGAASIDFMFKRYPAEISIPKVYWAIDTHQYLHEQKEKAKYFDLVFSAQHNALKTLGPHSVWLPAGAASHEIDYKLNRNIDVGFIGNLIPGLHDHRIRIIERLQKEFPQFVWIENIFLEEKARIVSSMKIMVNVSLNNDVNFRVFETLACGTFLLTDKIHENGLELLFEDGKHLVTYTTTEDLIHKIKYYLEHEEERSCIAKLGQQHVLQNYTHKNIVKKALNYFQALLDNTLLPTKITTAACWCGGFLVPSVHNAYLSCSSCDTQVSKTTCDSKSLKEFYQLETYWREYQEQIAGYPPIEIRAKNDFNGRIPVWHEILSLFKKHPQCLLEIGCSHGGFLRYCLDHGIETVVGVEVDEKTCAFARNHFQLPYISNGLFPDVNLPFSAFDTITGFDVLEHFIDPCRSIRAIADLLTDDGLFLFQTPCYCNESHDWKQFKPDEHLFLFNQTSIKQLFLQNGLHITDILPGYFPDDMFVIGKKCPKIAQIVYLRSDAIGDSVLSAGMLPYLKQYYQDAAITVVCQDRVAQLYDNCPYADDVISFNVISFFKTEAYRSLTIDKINRTKPTLIINPLYSHDLLNEFLAHHINAPLKITYEGDNSNRNREKLDTLQHLYTMTAPNNPTDCNELDHNTTFLKGLGITANNLEPMVWISDQEEKWAQDLLSQHMINDAQAIVLFPGTLLDFKAYPHYAEVVKPLHNYPLIIFGGEELRQLGDELSLAHGGLALNLTGQTTLGQMAALMKKSRIYLGADSAGMHIACAVGLKNVVILGGGHFGRFCPYSPLTTVVCLPLTCYYCNWKCVYDRTHCLHDMNPQIVLNAFKAALEDSTVPKHPTLHLQQASFYDDTPQIMAKEELLAKSTLVPSIFIQDFIQKEA